MAQQIEFMRHALELAKLGYATSPNPRVGCVIVKEDQVVGQGYHQRAGGPHAEINALQDAGSLAHGARAFITLEPCCHYGKTPPCTDALIASGITAVTIAMLDPNPLVAGKGVAALEDAGIKVKIGVLADEAQQLNRHFLHFITTKKPYVIAKWAMSLDGKTITQPGDSRQITHSEAQLKVHQLRANVDAILVGAATARTDNPRLTVRLAENHTYQPPLRIIVSRKGTLPTTLALFTDQAAPTLLILSDKARQHNLPAHIESVVLPSDNEGNIAINTLLLYLGNRHITSLLVEGGMQVINQFIAADALNEIDVYIAPTLIGTRTIKQNLADFSVDQHGQDIRLHTVIRSPHV